jgi:iron complex outermembrane receptor protein
MIAGNDPMNSCVIFSEEFGATDHRNSEIKDMSFRVKLTMLNNRFVFIKLRLSNNLLVDNLPRNQMVKASEFSNIYSRITRYNAQLGTPEINSYNDYNSKQVGSYLMLGNRFWSRVNVSTYLVLQRPSFSSNVSGDFLLSGITNFMGNINAFIKVLPKTTVQVLGFYTYARNSFQTRNGPTGYMTLGVQQKVLSDKMTIAVNFEDIFNTQQFPVSLYSDFLLMESLNKLTTRYVKLNLTYNFGQSFKSRQISKTEKDARVN